MGKAKGLIVGKMVKEQGTGLLQQGQREAPLLPLRASRDATMLLQRGQRVGSELPWEGQGKEAALPQRGPRRCLG